jgi:pyruvate dehydrogenase E2 component (dihydrolipoamide acetyltransferase)
MSTPVLMPQMGESIAEGTVVRWIKKVGDHVDRDEPLFEISTDKVDAEIPSPAAGVLAEIRVREGETVAVNSVVATIGDRVTATEQPDPPSPSASARQAPTRANLPQPDQPDPTLAQAGPTRPNLTQPDSTRPNLAQPGPTPPQPPPHGPTRAPAPGELGGGPGG